MSVVWGPAVCRHVGGPDAPTYPYEAPPSSIASGRQAGAELLPERLSVVGFDDIPAALAAGLTTIRQPAQDKGRLAARQLAEPTSVKPARTCCPAELIERTSTAPHPDVRTPAPAASLTAEDQREQSFELAFATPRDTSGNGGSRHSPIETRIASAPAALVATNSQDASRAASENNAGAWPDDACIREAASARAALPPRSPRTTCSRLA